MIVGYVFGYGSLVDPRDWALHGLRAPARYTHLRDHRRTWEVGIDNRSSIYDHKHYTEKDGSRASGVIATLGIYQSEGSLCNGLLIPVDTKRLDLFDQREISYRREDVSHFCTEKINLPVWTYFPEEESLDLYSFAKSQNKVRLPKKYFDSCTEAFRGWRGIDDFWRSTDRPTCPTGDLWLFRRRGLLGL